LQFGIILDVDAKHYVDGCDPLWLHIKKKKEKEKKKKGRKKGKKKRNRKKEE